MMKILNKQEAMQIVLSGGVVADMSRCIKQDDGRIMVITQNDTDFRPLQTQIPVGSYFSMSRNESWFIPEFDFKSSQEITIHLILGGTIVSSNGVEIWLDENMLQQHSGTKAGKYSYSNYWNWWKARSKEEVHITKLLLGLQDD